MNDQSRISYQPNLLDSIAATSSQESESGITPSIEQDGPEKFGRALALVNHFQSPEKEEQQAMKDISGQSGLTSSENADHQLSSASRSRVVTSSEGRRVILITCKVCSVEKNCDDFRTHGSRRKFRGTCRDCQNEAERKRRLSNQTRSAEQRKDWRRKNRGSALVSSARCRSREKNIPFDLDVTEIQRRIDLGRCEMTGMPFDLDGDWNSPSLDRIDPDGGYTMSNVRIVITALNVMMNRWGADKVLEIASALKSSTQAKKRSEDFTRRLQAAYQRRTEKLGSTLYTLTWKEHFTPSGHLIFRLRASERRIEGSDFYFVADARCYKPSSRRGNDAEMCGLSQTKRKSEHGAVISRGSSSNGINGLAIAPEFGRRRRGDGDTTRNGGEVQTQGRGSASGVALGDTIGPRLERYTGDEQNRDKPGRLGTNETRSITETGPTNGFWSDAEWIYCTDGKYRPSKPGIFPLAYGNSTGRVGILRGAGNAINAEQAIAFIESYREIEK